MPANSVFISHATKNDARVEELRHHLELLEVRVWADHQNLTAGLFLAKEIRSNIEACDVFLVLFTQDALNSAWVQKEIKHARKSKKRVIALLTPEIKIAALKPFFREEPVVIVLAEGASAITNALPQILAALEHILLNGIATPVEPTPPLIADLVLELTDPVIAERATAMARLVYCPADHSDRVEGDHFPFTAPLGPIEAEDLAWYLERYINWPSGYFEDRANRVVEALPQWGRLLYDSVGAEESANALQAWRDDETPERRFTVKVYRKANEASEAATILLGLPWELIHDEHAYLFQGARPVRVRRSLPNKSARRALATPAPIRVLLVSPRPEDDSAAYIDHRSSARPLVESLSQLGKLARFKLLNPPTFPALEAELTRAARAGEPYHVVHFDGHGVYDRKHGLGMLCFEDPADVGKFEARRSQLIAADEIAKVVHEHRIPLFFLEACQTAKTDTDPGASVAGRLLESGVASVAAMSHSVLVESARIFISDFYKELLHGRRVGQAMLAGQHALKANTFRGKSFSGEVRLHDWFVPVLFQEEQDPQLIREVPADRVAKIIATQRENALGDVPKPTHEFLGRSRDLLKAERMLAGARYLVVRGAGGEGKTTFAAELARWLVATQRFERAVFTSVETLTEARQVLFSVGDQLVPQFAGQAGTDNEHGRQLVERALGEHRTVVVIDNVESILASGPGEILGLCEKLMEAGQTRVIFTTREPLPAPFENSVLWMGRLDRDTAIRLLGNLLPNAPKSDETEEDLRNLVDAVGGHARSLVLIAREVGAAGVRHATENLVPVLRAIEAKNPGSRENSLLASAELSLRRLPPEIRQAIRPLSVFQGGGGMPAIGLSLKITPEQLDAIVDALIDVGLAEYVEPQFLRFDPALLGVELAEEERKAAITAWAEAMEAEVRFLYGQLFEDANLANNLTLLELPNFLAALTYIAQTGSPESVVALATQLESLVSKLNRPKALARIVEIRTAVAKNLPDWSNARFEAERASIERLIEQGRFSEAVQAALALNSKSEAAGESAYDVAAYDGALAQFTLGRAFWRSGNAEAAIQHLDRARERFERLNESRMTGLTLTHKADCLMNLGRYDEAAKAYQEAINISERLNNPRDVAVSKIQLGTLRLLQKKYDEALRLYGDARQVFEQLNELAMVAVAWHQIGNVYQDVGQFELAEQAYQNALSTTVQLGDRAGQGQTLNQLGVLYSNMGRLEEAVRLLRQAEDIAAQIGDLRSEGLRRSNVADQFVKLRRFDEARREIERAIECNKPFGHVAQPWKTFGILSDLEHAVGNQSAALEARAGALAAYLDYRRDGGAPQIDTARLIELVNQDPDAARAALDDPETNYAAAAEIILALGT